MSRWRALLRKELLDAMRNRAALLPVVLVAVMAIALPFIIVLVIPVLTGQSIGDDADLMRVSSGAGVSQALEPIARVQFFLFEQSLLLFLLLPITGAMALAAHAIIGEKQARTLEPLLATPVTTTELLVAKVVGALLPTLVITACGVVVYLGGIAVFAAPGVSAAMFGTRTALMLLVLGPAAALVALQTAVLISSRVNDARTAQQFGVLIIIPLAVLLVGQFTGAMWLSGRMIALVGGSLFAIWIVLTAFSVAVFDRESILTRWK
jgi:ABC-2 type transport system permease protein